MGRSHRQDHTKLCSEFLKTRVGRQIERIRMQNAAVGGRGFGRHLPCKKLEFSLSVDDAVLTVDHVPWPRRLGHPAAKSPPQDHTRYDGSRDDDQRKSGGQDDQQET